jgi:hypothetical protein
MFVEFLDITFKYKIMKNPDNYISPISPFYGEIEDKGNCFITDCIFAEAIANAAWYKSQEEKYSVTPEWTDDLPF